MKKLVLAALLASFTFGASAAEKINFGVSATYPPVSYTHLDVYKRQVEIGYLFPSGDAADVASCAAGSR